VPTVDLSSPTPPPDSLLAGLPRRISLTLPELRLVAERAGGAPLPFLAPAPEAGRSAGLESRLGPSRGAGDDAAYAAALAGLHEPIESLTRRGLLDAWGEPDPGLAGAVGLLATPRVAVDLDLNVTGAQLHAWHRHGRTAVATLATADGLVFELGWFATAQWPAELARVAALPAELPRQTSALPAVLDLPYELLDASGEAVRSGRADVVPVLAGHHSGRVVADGVVLPDAQVPGLLGALQRESRGRLRALVADLPDAGDGEDAPSLDTVGVTSWLLLADGWHALRPHVDTADGRQEGRVEVRRVEPADLATSLAPVLAEVSR
jgi:hypothetical protein